MADILIRGIEMPDNVEGCEVIIRIQPNGEVLNAHKFHIGATAIPLPEGHGRLGDLDALMPDFVKARWEFFSDGDTFLRLLKNAPTIVPAEGGTDDA